MGGDGDGRDTENRASARSFAPLRMTNRNGFAKSSFRRAREGELGRRPKRNWPGPRPRRAIAENRASARSFASLRMTFRRARRPRRAKNPRPLGRPCARSSDHAGARVRASVPGLVANTGEVSVYKNSRFCEKRKSKELLLRFVFFRLLYWVLTSPAHEKFPTGAARLHARPRARINDRARA